MSTEIIDDWIPIAEATRLVRSVRPGKRVRVSTLYRWVEQGRLDGLRRLQRQTPNGPRYWWFVRRSQVLAIDEVVPRPPVRPPLPVPRSAAEIQWQEEGERRHFGPKR